MTNKPNHYSNEMRAEDIRIAEAMGWTDIQDGLFVGDIMGRAPDAIPYASVPLFHTSEHAKAQLLSWIAQQPLALRVCFLSALQQILPCTSGMVTPTALLVYMTASPGQVVTAILEALSVTAFTR